LKKENWAGLLLGEKPGMAVDAGKMASGSADAVFAMLHVPLMS